MLSIFKNRYGELRSGWSIFAAMMLLIIGQMTARFIIPEGKEEEILVKIIVTLVYGALTIIGVIILFKLLYKRNLRQMGIIKEGWLSSLLYGTVLGTVSISLVFAVLIISGQAQITNININKLFSTGILVEFVSVCIFMFSEELFCRGYIMTALKTTRNKWVILLSSSVIFGVAHFLNPGMTFLSLFNTSFAGFLFAYMFVKSGKLWFPTGYHITWNFMSGDIFGISTSGGVNMSEGVFTTQLGANELLTGGIHGHEGGLIVTAVLLLSVFFVFFFVKKPNFPVWTIDSDLPLVRK